MQWLAAGFCLAAVQFGCDTKDPESSGAGGGGIIIILPTADMGQGGQGGQGGAGAEGGQGGEGGVVDMCGRRADVGDECPADPDCCARGSYCYNGSNSRLAGTCARECDADGVGCEDNELCSPDGAVRTYCRPSDNCIPGMENESCGIEGIVSCIRTENITQCVPHGALTRSVPLGGNCSSVTSACEPGLLCEFGTCRQACSDNGSCAQGEDCIDYTRRVGSQWRFCMNTCDLFAYNDEIREGGEGGMGGAGGAGGEDPADMGVPEADMGVPEADQGVPEADQGVPDGDQGVDLDMAAEPDAMVPDAMVPDAMATPDMMLPDVPPTPNSQCGEGDVCEFLFDHIEGLAAASCTEADAPGPLGTGDVCERGANYWGNCGSDFLCEPVGAGDDPTCLPICDRSNLDVCTGFQACAELFNGVIGAGVCFGECDVFQGDGCAPDEQCLLSNAGATAERPDKIIGFCSENANPGNQAIGEMCERDEATNTSTCGPGHLCQDFGNDFDECIKLCQEDAAGGECPDGYECRVGVFNGLGTLGICAR